MTLSSHTARSIQWALLAGTAPVSGLLLVDKLLSDGVVLEAALAAGAGCAITAIGAIYKLVKLNETAEAYHITAQALNGITAPTLVFDESGKCLQINSAADSLIEQHQIQAETAIEWVRFVLNLSPDESKRANNHAKQLLATLADTVSYPFTLNKDKFTLCLNPLRDESGDRKGTIVQILDEDSVTLNAQVTKEIQALNAVKHPIGLVDAKGHIRLVSTSLQTLLSKHSATLLRQFPEIDFNHLKGINLSALLIHDRNKGKNIHKLKEPYVTYIKSKRSHFQLTLYPLFDKSQKKLGTLIEWIDLNEEGNDAAVQDKLFNFESVFDKAYQPKFILNDEGLIIDANESGLNWMHQFNLSQPDSTVFGKYFVNCLDGITEANRFELKSHLDQVVDTNMTVTLDESQFEIALNFQANPKNGQSITVVSIHEKTERILLSQQKESNAKLKEQCATLEQEGAQLLSALNKTSVSSENEVIEIANAPSVPLKTRTLFQIQERIIEIARGIKLLSEKQMSEERAQWQNQFTSHVYEVKQTLSETMKTQKLVVDTLGTIEKALSVQITRLNQIEELMNTHEAMSKEYASQINVASSSAKDLIGDSLAKANHFQKNINEIHQATESVIRASKQLTELERDLKAVVDSSYQIAIEATQGSANSDALIRSINQVQYMAKRCHSLYQSLKSEVRSGLVLVDKKDIITDTFEEIFSNLNSATASVSDVLSNVQQELNLQKDQSADSLYFIQSVRENYKQLLDKVKSVSETKSELTQVVKTVETKYQSLLTHNSSVASEFTETVLTQTESTGESLDKASSQE